MSNQSADQFDFIYRNGKCLTNFEASTLLRTINIEQSDNIESTRKENLLKSRNYVDQFSQFEDGSTLEAARRMIRDFLSNVEGVNEMTEEEHDLWSRQVEADTVTILNLAPKTAKEARSYGLPSLARIDSDEELQEKLTSLDNFHT